jgi:hypothetical protein
MISSQSSNIKPSYRSYGGHHGGGGGGGSGSHHGTYHHRKSGQASSNTSTPKKASVSHKVRSSVTGDNECTSQGETDVNSKSPRSFFRYLLTKNFRQDLADFYTRNFKTIEEGTRFFIFLLNFIYSAGAVDILRSF